MRFKLLCGDDVEKAIFAGSSVYLSVLGASANISLGHLDAKIIL